MSAVMTTINTRKITRTSLLIGLFLCMSCRDQHLLKHITDGILYDTSTTTNYVYLQVTPESCLNCTSHIVIYPGQLYRIIAERHPVPEHHFIDELYFSVKNSTPFIVPTDVYEKLAEYTFSYDNQLFAKLDKIGAKYLYDSLKKNGYLLKRIIVPDTSNKTELLNKIAFLQRYGIYTYSLYDGSEINSGYKVYKK